MTQNPLSDLLKKARGADMTAEDRERQRQSFAYGNTHAENDKITRATIADAAERLTNGASGNTD